MAASNSGGSRRKPLTKGQREYLAKLRNPKWQKYRDEIYARDGWSCTWCGAGLEDGRNLQAHHGFYSRECEYPWKYPRESIWTHCEWCHKQAEVTRQQVYEALGHLNAKFHHHVFECINEVIEAVASGVQVESHRPWKPVGENV